MSTPPFSVNPIGHVRVNGDDYVLEIDQAYRAALRALDGFSHVNVLWWCHHVDQAQFRAMTVAETPYRDGPEVVGIFATRSPARPNPIALTTAPILTVDMATGLVPIAYIDAEDGSPILDLKPYLPCTDRVRDPRCPDWCASWPQWYEDSAAFDWEAVFENAQ